MSESMFEKASRLKIRFPSAAGNLNTEDLWDLPLDSRRTNQASLNNVAQLAYAQTKANEEVSFVSAPTAGSAIDTLRLELVKHVIAVRLAENAAAAESKAKAQEREKIRAIIESKKDKALEELSIEELEARL